MEGDIIYQEPRVDEYVIRAPPPTPEKPKRKRKNKEIVNKKVRRDLTEEFDKE